MHQSGHFNCIDFWGNFNIEDNDSIYQIHFNSMTIKRLDLNRSTISCEFFWQLLRDRHLLVWSSSVWKWRKFVKSATEEATPSNLAVPFINFKHLRSSVILIQRLYLYTKLRSYRVYKNHRLETPSRGFCYTAKTVDRWWSFAIFTKRKDLSVPLAIVR